MSAHIWRCQLAAALFIIFLSNKTKQEEEEEEQEQEEQEEVENADDALESCEQRPYKVCLAQTQSVLIRI